MIRKIVYDSSTQSYRGLSTNVGVNSSSTKIKAYDDFSLMNGSPFGPFNPDQPIDGTKYKQPKKIKKT